LLAYAGQSDILFAFQNIANYGQALYLDNIQVVDIGTVGLSSYKNETQFTIFPNPNNGSFNIEINNAKEKNYQLEIFNSLGEIIYSENSFTKNNSIVKQIQLENVAKGIYFIQIKGLEKSSIKKIIIH
jgi:hypothetical protein